MLRAGPASGHHAGMPSRKTIITPARGRPRSAASEKAILDATLKLLHEEGYAALTTDRLAAVAKVSKATIYRRWPTKEHLVLTVMENLPLAEVPEGKSFEEELLALFRQAARITRSSGINAVLPKLAAECVGNPELSAALIRVNHHRREPLRRALRRAIARGEVDARTDLEMAIDFIQGAIAIRSLFLLEELKPAWAKKLARTIVSGIGAVRR